MFSLLDVNVKFYLCLVEIGSAKLSSEDEYL